MPSCPNEKTCAGSCTCACYTRALRRKRSLAHCLSAQNFLKFFLLSRRFRHTVWARPQTLPQRHQGEGGNPFLALEQALIWVPARAHRRFRKGRFPLFKALPSVTEASLRRAGAAVICAAVIRIAGVIR